jgi:hypothetical protein
MTLFTGEDHQALITTSDNTSNTESLQRVYNKFNELHQALYRRLREHHYDLHPHWVKAEIIGQQSASAPNAHGAMVLPYFRSKEQVYLVERLMGRERVDTFTEIEFYRHPVIELRLTPEHFTIELILSPMAWWDQQNFVGKIGISRHRETFRTLLQRMPGEYLFGFWDGVELSDMHLTTHQLVRANHLHEWMSTFAEGQDYLRLGMWYTPGDPALDASRIVPEIAQRIGALYSLYNFLLWTSNNDFHSFYQKGTARPGLPF